ncbi:hypothetical protein DY000_02004444 [Brassica cretica]|uniref:F-box domain-containing protein n=1 Tax=Brassica cretica TaxID=69181 RepID=A0ABQ7C656_BRACR|nr:hypothetical protein DY000_02004444 [Brassica cretica]
MVIPSLPWELESEILSRVPPTSVKQLRFTCKRWNALFKDYRFMKNHLCKAAAQMVLKKDKSVYSFSFDFHGIHNRYDQFITFTGKLLSLKDSEDVEIYKTFHCEGLLLCTTKDSRLVVWNPCTGQTRWIQSRLPSNSYTEYQTCFLGYGNKNKSCYSFKILRFNFTTERFERLSLPSQSDDSEAGEVISHWVLSVVREEKLALLSQNFVYYSPLEMKIWMTNTKADEVKDLSYIYLMMRVVSFLVDEENEKVMCCHQEDDDQESTRIYVAGQDIYINQSIVILRKLTMTGEGNPLVHFSSVMFRVWSKFQQSKNI